MLSQHQRGLLPRHHAPDRRLDVAEDAARLLDAGPGRRADVHLELAGVDVGKEVLAHDSAEEQRAGHEQREHDQDHRRMPQARRQHTAIRLAERVEAALEPFVHPPEGIAPAGPAVAARVPSDLARQQVHDHRRHQRARQQIRRQDREDDRERHRDEQELHDAAEERHRHEHDADGERGDEGGHRDLLGPVEDRLAQWRAEAEVAVDVLDLHGRVVDEDPDRQREAAQRHQVDRVTEGAQRDERRQHGQRDRRGHDQRAAPAAEEDEDHEAGQARGQRAVLQHAVEGRAHEHGLIEERADVHLRRQSGAQGGQVGPDPVDDGERGGAFPLEHGEQDGAAPVLADDVLLDGEAVAHVRDVADVDHASAGALDGQVVEPRHGLRAAVEAHGVLAIADLRRAARQDEVLVDDRLDDLGGGHALAAQGLRIQVHHDLAHLAPVR